MQYAEMFKAAQRDDEQAGEVRDGDAGAGGVRGPGRALHDVAGPDHGAVGTPSTRSCTTWRMPDVRSFRWRNPEIHLLAARGYVDKVINPEFMLKVFNNTVKGLRAKTEVWCHTCWGNPSQQRMFGSCAELQARARAVEPVKPLT